jgi:hypothetical protein
MAAQAQVAPMNFANARHNILEKLARADVSTPVRESLGRSLEAMFKAHREAEDDEKVVPDPRSFGNLLAFLEQPYRHRWLAPGIAVNSYGNFVAVWEQSGVDRWVIDFSPNGEYESIHLHTSPDGNISDGHHKGRIGPVWFEPPFAIPEKN